MQLDYSGLDVKVVMEGTGVHLTSRKLQPYFGKGVLKVVVSAPVKDGNENTVNVVVGCNEVRPGVSDPLWWNNRPAGIRCRWSGHGDELWTRLCGCRGNTMRRSTPS